MDANRLRWACRRGMLELDLVLMDFLDHHYEKLSEAHQHAFEHLLSSTDPELMDWLLKDQIVRDEFSEIVSMIKSHAKRLV